MTTIYTLAWVPMVFIAIANGILRDRGYKRYLPELRAHQLSTVIGAALFTIYTWIVMAWWPLPSDREALGIGAIWVALTIGFEVGFGHLVLKFTWRRLAMDYNLLKGRIWSLLLVWLFLLPLVMRRFMT